MLKEQNNVVIENGKDKLIVTTNDKALLLKISKEALSIPYSMDFEISAEDAKELIKVLLMYLDKD